MQAPNQKSRSWIIHCSRLMIWALAALYLIVEGREITQLRQLTTFSIFAVLFVVGSFQINVSRLLLSVSSRKEASDAYRASIRMFLASLLAVIDGCMDVAISGMTASVTPLLPPRILGLSWDHDRREIQLVDQIEQEIHLMVSSQPVTR
jgi:hypothetical protein